MSRTARTATATATVDAVDNTPTVDAVDAATATPTETDSEMTNTDNVNTDNTDAPTDDNTDAARAITTADAYAATNPDRDNVVSDYRGGVVTKTAATNYANSRMADAVTDGTTAMGAGNTDAALAAMADASAWSTVVTELSAATRTPIKTGPVLGDYVAAGIARAIALRDAAYAVGRGSIVPSDVPDAMADDYRAAIVAAWSDRANRVSDDAQTAHAHAYAARNIVSNGGIKLDPHFADVWARTPTGTVLSFADIARESSSAWPSGIANGSGRVGARFINPKTGTPWPSDRMPTGWVLDRTARGSRGARRVDVADAPTGDVVSESDNG